jgi:beta-xylosidase
MNLLKVAVLFTSFVLAQNPPAQHPRKDSSVWSPDRGDGTYRNPIIYADYSDPDAIRVGGDFYMVASSFNSAPGIPILHSKDLVGWKIIGHVFEQQIPIDVFRKPQHGNGVWAPAIRYHKGEFYIYYPDPDFGIYLTKAKKPTGPWSRPLLIKQAKGWIDPCPFWDDDGNAYLVHAWANSRSGIKSILTINRMSADGERILDEGRTVFDGRINHPTIEGPKLYKRNGYYYIFAPAGGVPTGWQTVLRSRNIYGSYEDRIVLARGKTEINGPHQGAWIELQSGESWFLHFQDLGAYGRVVHLQPMQWKDDWPVIGDDDDGDGVGEPVLSHRKPNVGASARPVVPQTSDEFESKARGPQWQWHANFEANWSSLSARPGWLRLNTPETSNSGPNLWSVPNLLLQKLPAPSFTVTTRMEFAGLNVGQKSGLLLMGADYAYIAIERTSSGFRLVRVTCGDADKGSAEITDEEILWKGKSVMLRMQMVDGGIAQFSYSRDGTQFFPIGKKFKARPGHWIGAKVGLFSVGDGPRGFAEYDWFRFH